MNLINCCPVEESIKTHCDQVDTPERTCDEFLECADYLIDYVKGGHDLHFEDAHPLKANAVIGDYLADTNSAFNEFKLMLTDPIAASAQANKNIEAYIADTIYQECLKNDAFPLEYNFNYAA